MVSRPLFVGVAGGSLIRRTADGAWMKYRTPMSVAKKNNHQVVVRMLQTAGALEADTGALDTE
eukprot:4852557-Pyramimonas_sp.AAC.1